MFWGDLPNSGLTIICPRFVFTPFNKSTRFSDESLNLGSYYKKQHYLVNQMLQNNDRSSISHQMLIATAITLRSYFNGTKYFDWWMIEEYLNTNR